MRKVTKVTGHRLAIHYSSVVSLPEFITVSAVHQPFNISICMMYLYSAYADTTLIYHINSPLTSNHEILL